MTKTINKEQFVLWYMDKTKSINDLCIKFGVSRHTIWKRANELQLSRKNWPRTGKKIELV